MKMRKFSAIVRIDIYFKFEFVLDESNSGHLIDDLRHLIHNLKLCDGGLFGWFPCGADSIRVVTVFHWMIPLIIIECDSNDGNRLYALYYIRNRAKVQAKNSRNGNFTVSILF